MFPSRPTTPPAPPPRGSRTPALLAPLGAAVVAVGSTVARRSRSRGMPPPTGPPLASKVIDLAGERVRRATVPTVNRRDAGGGLG
ncbi:MAG: hypothetical protein ACM3ZF_05710 [Mycobacterium leprae]